MSGFSDYTEAALLNSLFGKTSDFGALASVPTLYVGLLTAAPNDASTSGSVTESAYTSYARVTTTAGNWSAATGTSPTEISNSAELAFPTSTGGTSVVTHFALFDVVSGAGNMIAWGELGSSKTIDSGDTPSFAVSSLEVTLN